MLRFLITSCIISKHGTAAESVHPIVIDGKHFVDSVTNERFFLRGIDYQPGGAAAYDRNSDPLSNSKQCARDVYLMQELGVNTVRVYTVNPKLSHDDCMTMLAAANIYLVLDINSPLVAESINRYEPWTTYTPEYLRHVFEVIHQFSSYNNTLGFFIGNEIVNDERSAGVSPPYVRAVARDVKDYMYYNCPRQVPIGYSAADDLRYRVELPHYLTCGDSETAVDFYGVNSYQWCGEQTFETSGYDVLIRDHEEFDFPIFFSETGCNHIQPRIFQEIEAIYSPRMTPVFEGGLVYEFSQEENDYGLVQIDASGHAHLKEDFFTLQKQFRKTTSLMEEETDASDEESPSELVPRLVAAPSSVAVGMSVSGVFYTPREPTRFTKRARRDSKANQCASSYDNLSGASKTIPESFGTDMIRNGVQVKRGKYNPEILDSMPACEYDIYDLSGAKLSEPQIKIVNQFDASAVQNWKLRTGINVESESIPKNVRKAKNRAPHGNFSWRFLGVCLLFFLQNNAF